MPGPPKQLGPYQIDQEIGRGGMGVVYLARDTRLDRPVAIKTLPEHLAQDPDRLARFEREARTLAALTHPNVAGIYGIETHDNAKYLILEYVEGETLAERLDRGQIPVDEALELATQIAAGVEAAHEAGVIHRDLKPDNIKITPDGQIKVLDFGLAKSTETQTSASSTNLPTVTSPAILNSPTIPGAIMGTAPYMSPEQARGRTVDKRTDIWSFGVILYEMLTSASPFRGETVSDSIGAILHKDVDRALLPPETPRAVRRVLERCLERDKNKRFRDIGDIRLELESADDPIAAEAATASSGIARWGVTAVLLVIVAAAGWFGASSLRHDAPASVNRFDVVTDSPRAKLFATSPKLSPDGKRLAYIQDDQINIRELASFDSRPLPGTKDAQDPFWSPDGKWIGYHTNSAIYKISLTGGSAIKLNTGALSLGGEAAGCWTDDGRIIYADGDLMQISAMGGEPTVLYKADDERFIDFHDPSLIPGTNTVLYVEHRSDQTFAVAAYNGKESVVLAHVHVTEGRIGTPCYATPGQVLYTKIFTSEEVWAIGFDHKKMTVTGDPYLVEPDAWDPTTSNDGALAICRGTSQLGGSLAWLNRTGDLEPIEGDFEAVLLMLLSPDGKHIVFSAGAPPKFDLWIRDLDRQVNRRITFAETFVGASAWSPDSKEIAYIEINLVAGASVVTKFVYADGSGESRPQIEGGLLSFDATWTNAILTKSLRQSNTPIQAISIENPEDGTEIAAMTLGDQAVLSPDGTLIVYTANESGESQVYCTRYPDGSGKWQLSTRGGKNPAWSVDGAKVFYEIEGDEAGIYEIHVTREPSLQFGLPQRIFDLTDVDIEPNNSWDLTPDAQRLLLVQSKQDKIEVPNTISIIQNWYEEHRDR